MGENKVFLSQCMVDIETGDFTFYCRPAPAGGTIVLVKKRSRMQVCMFYNLVNQYLIMNERCMKGNRHKKSFMSNKIPEDLHTLMVLQMRSHLENPVWGLSASFWHSLFFVPVISILKNKRNVLFLKRNFTETMNSDSSRRLPRL